jgi:cytochrome c oxidase subunit 2
MPLTRKTPPRLVSLALPLVAILLAGCAALYPPQDVTSQGAATRSLYDIVFVIAAVIFFAVEGAIVWIVLRYRRKPTDTELPSQFHGNNLIELIWTIIPTVIVLYMFVISWQTLQTVEAKDPNPAVRVVANAQRFAWSFGYLDANGKPLVTNPDGSPYVFYGTLEVPPGAPVHVLLRSPDVIHAFYVPKFLFKRDVVPQQDNNFDFNVDPGDAGQTFHGQCAELCGIGHGTMTFDVHAQASLAAFQAWLQASIDCHCSASVPKDGAPGASGPPPASAPTASGAAPSGPAPSGPAASGPPPSGPTASGAAPSGATIPISAANTAFSTATLEAPAGTPFSIAFSNNDNGVPHNVDILDANGGDVFKGDIVTGPTTVTYQVPALPAGSYQFRCLVHPSMTGTLTVK